MKTRLLKKIRNLHPIYFDTNTKKYQYKTVNGKMCMDDFWEYDYKSEWIDDYRPLLNARRELIIKDARVYFFKTLFSYKRKRTQKIYRYF